MRLLIVLLLLAVTSNAATHYVDGTATNGANTGASWANAWTNFAGFKNNVTNGDIVYASGGTNGASQTYQIVDDVSYPGLLLTSVQFSPGAAVTIQVGQDSAHNGTIILDGNGAANWLGYPRQVTISGDAGDGAMHIVLTNYAGIGVGDNSTNFTLSYVNCGSISNGISFNPGVNIQIDHCYFKIIDLASDHFSYASFAGTNGYDQNKFFNNTLLVPAEFGASGYGADMLQWNGNGQSIHDNIFVHYPAAYTGNQHADGWQPTGLTSYAKYYGNKSFNAPNYAVYLDAYTGGFTNVLVYNNIFYITNSDMSVSNVGFVAISGGTSAGYIGVDPCTFSNVQYLNNTFVDYTNAGASISMGLGNDSSFATVFTNCLIANNVGINGGSLVYIVTNGVTTGICATNSNHSLTSPQGSTNFVSYSAFAAGNDLRLLSTSDLIGAGTNLNSYFTTDFAGTTRGATWDIGAYEYTAGGGDAGAVRRRVKLRKH